MLRNAPTNIYDVCLEAPTQEEAGGGRERESQRAGALPDPTPSAHRGLQVKVLLDPPHLLYLPAPLQDEPLEGGGTTGRRRLSFLLRSSHLQVTAAGGGVSTPSSPGSVRVLPGEVAAPGPGAPQGGWSGPLPFPLMHHRPSGLSESPIDGCFRGVWTPSPEAEHGQQHTWCSPSGGRRGLHSYCPPGGEGEGGRTSNTWVSTPTGRGSSSGS